MVGRDPHEGHRSASPLELLFDLTFVVAFAQAGDQLAHYIAEGHIGTAIGGFSFIVISICWAWINYTWFASAFDTDDWFHRILTMVQMVGVIILALGIPAVFASIDAGESMDSPYRRGRIRGHAGRDGDHVAEGRHPGSKYRRTALLYVVFTAGAQDRVGDPRVPPHREHPAARRADRGVVGDRARRPGRVDLGRQSDAPTPGRAAPWHARHITGATGCS